MGSLVSFPAGVVSWSRTGPHGGEAFLWDEDSGAWPPTPRGPRHRSAVRKGGQQLGLSVAQDGLMVKASVHCCVAALACQA